MGVGLRFLWGAPAAALVAWVAIRLGWLRGDGAVAAAVVGLGIYGFGGLRAAGVLLAFFLTATLVGKLPRGPKHGPRDARQVIANGGVAVLGALLLALRVPLGVAVLAGALASANADTWATEIGTRYGGAPRRLGFGPRLSARDSGGMTVIGTLGGGAGAALIAVLAGGWPAVIGGVAGMAADSLLGGTLQAVYRCPACGQRLEQRRHGCGVAADRVRGLPWMDNDAVNLMATVIGAVVTTALVAR